MSTFYGVWIGRQTGVYDNWNDCKSQVDKYPNAKFHKLKAQTKESALIEFEQLNHNKKSENSVINYNDSKKTHEKKERKVIEKPNGEFLTVDGASNGKNCEFQAVWYPSGKKQFSSKVFEGGTNNIAEFLALVLGIKYLKDNNLPLIIYTDSTTAMAWFENKKANTTARQTGKLTEELEQLLNRSEQYLIKNEALMKTIKIMKWETKDWGEIPADFGRK